MRRWHVPGLILLGGLAAAICLVKINLGIFVIVAAALAFTVHLPDSWFSRAGFSAAGAASISMPAILMRSHLDEYMTRILRMRRWRR